MARYGRIRSRTEDDPDINLIPIMNMFMVLIPFLLMSASFFHVKAINTSIPVHAKPSAVTDDDRQLRKITVVLEIKSDRVRISTLEETPNDLQESVGETVFQRPSDGELPVGAVAGHLAALKRKYPDSDTMLLIPDDDVSYHEIIRTMDIARVYESETLFTNVVLSGSLG
jgi:biopolymer transport protein ExbD